MEVLALLLGLVLAILVLWFHYWISMQFYLAAVDKGYTDKKYLWIPFFCTAIGYALVIALPDKKGIRTNNVQEMSDDLPEL